MQRIARRAGLAALLLGALGGWTSAQASDFAARREAARAELVRAIDGYLEWCQSKSLFLARKTACEFLLELEPEHAEARKALGYTRAKDGTWKAPEKPKTPRDFDQKALAEAAGRWREATAGYASAMVGLLEAGALSEAEKELAAREALRVDPENERVHVLLGEVKGEKGWVLPETQRAKQRRAELFEAVQAAFEGAPPVEPVELTERERRIPLKFKAFAAPGLRVLGTTGEEELRLCAQAMFSLQAFLQTVFATKHALPADCTVFLFDPRELPVFAANHPALPESARAGFERQEGGGVPGTNDFAFWTGDTQRRVDGIVRLALGFWLSGAFQIETRTGWAYEGFGLVLTRALIRSRLTWLATPAAVSDPKTIALRQRLIDPKTNWMDEALRMLQEERAPALDELVRKDASQLTTEDVLYAYALATFLLEAHHEALSKMLKRLGTGYPGIAALQEAVGMDAATLERRLERWLTERVG
jgi:hypothetical protein